SFCRLYGSVAAVLLCVFLLCVLPPPLSILFPYTTLFRSLGHRIACELSPSEMLPAVGQGIVAVECAVNDWQTRRHLALIDDSARSEEHTSELQSRFDLVCRLLLEKRTDGRASRVSLCCAE